MEKNNNDMFPVNEWNRFCYVVNRKLIALDEDREEQIRLKNEMYSCACNVARFFPDTYDIFTVQSWNRSWDIMLGRPTFDFQYLYPTSVTLMGLHLDGLNLPDHIREKFDKLVEAERKDKEQAKEFLHKMDEEFTGLYPYGENIYRK